MGDVDPELRKFSKMMSNLPALLVRLIISHRLAVRFLSAQDDPDQGKKDQGQKDARDNGDRVVAQAEVWQNRPDKRRGAVAGQGKKTVGRWLHRFLGRLNGVILALRKIENR